MRDVGLKIVRSRERRKTDRIPKDAVDRVEAVSLMTTEKWEMSAPSPDSEAFYFTPRSGAVRGSEALRVYSGR